MTCPITPQLLASNGACQDQVDKFALRWPKGGEVTLENCIEASRLGLNLAWAAENLLTAPALQAYEEATATAWKAYQEATATAFCTAWKIDHA